ncbi:MAG TPA: hypothetical protein VHG30_06410 [Microvirga sp.]|nr:hypothetical protein [Microvirga sp.]
MDCVVRAGGPNIWTVESSGGAVVGAIERRPEGFAIVPSAASPLGDLDPLPYASLEAAMAAIGAHCQGTCRLADDG